MSFEGHQTPTPFNFSEPLVGHAEDPICRSGSCSGRVRDLTIGAVHRCTWVLTIVVGCGSESSPLFFGPTLECRTFVVPNTDDTDADGLLDDWEAMHPAFDPSNPDSDHDGIPDGAEDDDQDQLSARQEWLSSSLASFPEMVPPRFDQSTVLVELDFMEGFAVEELSLEIARNAFAAIDIDLRFFVDECNIDFALFDGSFEQRQDFFEDHQALNVPTEIAASLIHVMFAARQLDRPFRPAEAISDGGGITNRSGVFIYLEPILDAHPRCGGTGAPSLKIFEAVGGALVHELGHTLQLGHDTELNGGINFYNVMSQTSSCLEAQRRHRGLGNRNPDLGSTEAVGRPRFSTAARGLMDLRARLSVDTGRLVNGTGYDM